MKRIGLAIVIIIILFALYAAMICGSMAIGETVYETTSIDTYVWDETETAIPRYGEPVKMLEEYYLYDMTREEIFEFIATEGLKPAQEMADELGIPYLLYINILRDYSKGQYGDFIFDYHFSSIPATKAGERLAFFEDDGFVYLYSGRKDIPWGERIGCWTSTERGDFDYYIYSGYTQNDVPFKVDGRRWISIEDEIVNTKIQIVYNGEVVYEY